MLKQLLGFGIAHAQELIPCPDGTMADPAVGCATPPVTVVNPSSSLLEIILRFSGILMTFIVSVATMVLIYGGIRYAMAAGDQDQTQSAKRVMFWAVFGLVLGLLARFVVQFILNVIT